MSVSLGDIVAFIRADDSKAESDLRAFDGKATNWISGLGGKVATLLGGVITAAIGGAVALGATAFVAGQSLDEAFDTLLIKTDATGGAFEQLKEDYKSVFAGIPTAAGPAAEVLATLHNRTTLVGEANQELAKQILESARIMGGDATANAELYTRMMGDWSIANEDASETLDKVFIASQNTGIGMDRLMQLSVQFGAPMRLMGFSLEDSIALLSKWEKEGVNTELVMGSLRIAAGNFASEGKPLRESLLSTFDAIKNNTDETAALNLAMEVFGARAGPDMAAAIREGRFEFEDLLPLLDDAGGSILETAAMTEDWGEKLTKLKNKAILSLGPIGLKMMDMASMILDKAAPAFDKLIPLIDQYAVPVIDKLAQALGLLLEGDMQGALSSLFGSETATQVMAFAETFGTFTNDTLMPFVNEHSEEIIGALTGIGAVLAGSMIVAGITAIGTAIASVGAPVLALIAIAALLGAAWNSNWGGIQEKTQLVIDFVKNLIDGGTQFINDLMNGRLGLLSSIVLTALNNIKTLFAAFQAAFDGDWRKFGELLRVIWDNNWKLLGEILQTAWVNMKAKVSEGLANIRSAFTETNWGEVGLNLLRGVANGITSGLSIIRDAAVRAARAALDAMEGFLGISSPAKAPVVTDIGENTAEGIGLSFQKKMGMLGLGESVTDSLGGVSAMPSMAGGAPMVVHVNFDKPFTLFDEYQVEDLLRPIFRRLMNEEV